MSESSNPMVGVSASVVAHLYGDRFSAPPKPGAAVAACYSSGRPTDTRAVATVLVAIALWDLRRRAAISLEPYREKRLFGTRSGVRVRLRAEVSADGVDAAIQAALVRGRKPRESGVDAQGLVHAAVPGSSKPFDEVIGMAVRQEAAGGYVTLGLIDGPVDNEGTPGQPRSHYYPVAEAIAALAPSADVLLADWNVFGEQEGELRRMLLEAAANGIVSSTRTTADRDD